jgi:dihydroflavonol-4-reductase
MRIAVIGATGLLGNHVSRVVAASGEELVVLHRRGSDLARLAGVPFTPALADLAHPSALAEALAGVDGVVNCAAPYPTVPRPWQAEVGAGLDLMEGFYRACAEADVPRILYVGGSIALAARTDGEPADERCTRSDRPGTSNAYVQLKWALDRQAIEHADEGLPVVVGIPGLTLGEFDWGPSTGQLLVGIASGSLTRYVPGRRNALYAGDAARGLLAALYRGTPGRRYLITGENMAMDELVTETARQAGVPPPRPVSLGAARLLSRLQHVRYRFGGPLPLLSATAIAVMGGGQFLDGTRAREELGYAPRVSVAEAISRALAWFRQTGHLGKS